VSLARASVRRVSVMGLVTMTGTGTTRARGGLPCVSRTSTSPWRGVWVVGIMRLVVWLGKGTVICSALTHVCARFERGSKTDAPFTVMPEYGIGFACCLEDILRLSPG